MAAAGNESASAPRPMRLRPMRQRPMRRRPMRRLGMAAIGAGLLALPLVAAAPSARVAQVSEERGSRLIDRPNVV